MPVIKPILSLSITNILLLTILFAGCSSSDSSSDPISIVPADPIDTINTVTSTDVADTPTTLSEKEKDGIYFMREEEKLARDVYLELFAQWGLNLFNNIAKSEQNHTDAVLSLIDRYGLTDPASDVIGEFTDQELQHLYNDLMALGMSDSQNALWAGALIEETDIQDIVDWMNQTDNADIFQVYENLLCGSRNHLRSFVKQIEADGGTYINQIPDVEQEVNDILSTSMEQCS